MLVCFKDPGGFSLVVPAPPATGRRGPCIDEGNHSYACNSHFCSNQRDDLSNTGATNVPFWLRFSFRLLCSWLLKISSTILLNRWTFSEGMPILSAAPAPKISFWTLLALALFLPRLLSLYLFYTGLTICWMWTLGSSCLDRADFPTVTILFLFCSLEEASLF